MSRKLMVLGLAVVLVVAVAIPVVAQERVVTPRLEAISKRALQKSRTALKTSRSAKRQSRRAEEAAQVATGSAAGAAADINSTRIRTAVADGEAGTSFEGFVALAGGPLVEVTVPASGLIEVWAQATIDGDGAVSLYEDGRPLPGQAEVCAPGPGTGVLFGVEASVGEPIVVGTPTAVGLGICGSLGAPGPVLFRTSPGVHTYELRYADCGCGDSPVFSDRRLSIGPRL
jgi:hypothetical protein